jgi:hypothetical protein
MRFSREPAAWLNVLSAAIALAVGLGAFGLTENVGQAVIAFATAITTAIIAFRVRPIVPTLLAGTITTGFALLAALNVIHVSEKNTGLAVFFAEVLLTAVAVRPFSTPINDPAPATHTV